MKQSSKILVIMFGMFSLAIAQPKSAVQFWDTTGTTETASFGWNGDAATGKFFIEAPKGSQILNIQNGQLNVAGPIQATQFTGDGNGLTNINPSSHAHLQYLNLQQIDSAHYSKKQTDSLFYHKTKVDSLLSGINVGTTTLSGIANVPGLIDTLKKKADTSEVNKLFSGGTVGQVWKKTASNNYTWATDTVGNGTITGVVAGSGLNGGGTASNVTLSATLALSGGNSGNNGTKDTIARSDHAHAGTYQPVNTNLDDLADGSLTGSKVGSGINATNITSGSLQPSQIADLGTTGIKFSSGSGRTIEIRAEAAYSGNALRIRDITGAAICSYYDPSSSVGNGMKAHGWLSASGSVGTEANFNCQGNVFCSSDRRLKKNIKPIEEALNGIGKLNGVTFDWDSTSVPGRKFDKGRQIGVIAQEVESVYPELVNTNADGYKSVAYDKLVAVLIEAVKQQQKIITDQADALKHLNDELEAQKNDIANIKKMISAKQIR